MLGLKLFLVVFLILQTSTLNLEIGEVVSKTDIEEFSTQSLILHGGDLKPSIEKKISGVTYRIAYEPENNTIIQINCNDPNFVTTDGVRQGSYIEATKRQILVTKSSNILGPETKDGWRTDLGTDFEIVVLKKGSEERIILRDDESGSWSMRTARKQINKLFAANKTIRVRVERFSKIKE